MWSDRDLALALQLQEQFNAERTDSPAVSIVDPPKPPKQNVNLGDEELELIDPTPDIHALFIQFDKKFFWGTLSSVVVRWSKRMYSCAGICRYQGRSGMCDIALSEPLLKLRPRKNLIETLLHEMIHAYLFVSVKDRDRDGHGPNFQAHMHRINREANINITIYHSFIDEVRLYKVHWWRCNGVCQNQKPFFGIVRRSSNRAPSPNDFWWERHRLVCGGNFIKIKEPEKKKPTKKPVAVKPDIRKFFSPTKSADNRSTNVEIKPPTKKLKLDFPMENKKGKISKGSKNDNSIKNNDSQNNPKSTLNIENSPKSQSPSVVVDTVRNHWRDKYVSNNLPTKTSHNKDDNLSKISNTVDITQSKNNNPPISLNKINTENVLQLDIKKSVKTKENLHNCPICNIQISPIEINEHLDICLTKQTFNDNMNVPDRSPVIDEIFSSQETIPNESLPSTSHCKEWLNLNNSSMSGSNLKECPVCEKFVEANCLEDHLESCLNNTFNDNNEVKCSDNSIISLTDSDDDFELNDNKFDRSVNYVPCPCCCELIDENEIAKHVELCLVS